MMEGEAQASEALLYALAEQRKVSSILWLHSYVGCNNPGAV